MKCVKCGETLLVYGVDGSCIPVVEKCPKCHDYKPTYEELCPVCGKHLTFRGYDGIECKACGWWFCY